MLRFFKEGLKTTSWEPSNVLFEEKEGKVLVSSSDGTWWVADAERTFVENYGEEPIVVEISENVATVTLPVKAAWDFFCRRNVEGVCCL